jgi:mono/diheme cytochrome c family protein
MVPKDPPNVDKADPTGPDPPLKMPAYNDLISGQELQDLFAYIMGFGSGQKKKNEW